MANSWVEITKGKFDLEIVPHSEKVMEIKVFSLHRKKEDGEQRDNKTVVATTSLMFTSTEAIDTMINALRVAKHKLGKK